VSATITEEVQHESFRERPAAVLDESKAPDLAVLTRFSEKRMLRGSIKQARELWLWEFVLDTEAPHEGCQGVAASYEEARAQLAANLAQFNVALECRSTPSRSDLARCLPNRDVLSIVTHPRAGNVMIAR
jgi:hypothetical protein